MSDMNKTFMVAVAITALAASAPGASQSKGSDAPAGMTNFDLVRAKVENTTYRGRKAVKVVPGDGVEGDKDMLAVLPGITFGDGTIEVDVAGAPCPGCSEGARGFIGVAFRVQDGNERYEMFYVRPVNARYDDQLIRNHATQYISAPTFSWRKLRQESPGVYESYADMETGAWTHLKIVVSGKRALLHVNGADQPCLVVKDLKLGETRGRVALWAHISTDAYFSGLTVR